jgi:hypothetical protein
MAARATLTLVLVLTVGTLVPAQTQDLADVHGAIVEVNQQVAAFPISAASLEPVVQAHPVADFMGACVAQVVRLGGATR